MEAAGLVVDALDRVCAMVREALKDLTPEELLAPPKPHIAWLAWHIARVQDVNFAGLLDRPQLWIADGWHRRFNMPPDPETTARVIVKPANKWMPSSSPTSRCCSLTTTPCSRRRKIICRR